jgi:hypothetical protein
MSADTIFHTSPLERVHEGMTVEDSARARLGKVKRLHMGDSEAVTIKGQESAGTSVGVAAAPASSSGGTTAFGGATPVANVADAPELPEPLRTRLWRTGFIELEDTHLEGPDRYIPGDRIDEVNDQTVTLKTTTSAVADRDPVLRTYVGTPRYVVKSSGRFSRKALLIGTGGASLVAAGAALGAWIYQRRQRRARIRARIRMSLGGVAGALLLMLVARMIVNRSSNDMPGIQALADMSERAPGNTAFRSEWMPRGLAALVVSAGFVWWVRRRPEHQPRYIGTPGVESAYGRDRVGSGELPAEYGVEHAH